MNVVVTLASKLPVRGFNIYMDNFYSTVPLFRYLHNIKQNVIGTTRSNRISPLLLMKKKEPRGSLKWMATTRMNNETIDSAPILACSWRDSGVVYFMSTLHRGDETTIIQRQKVELQKLMCKLQSWLNSIANS
jgi:hypothetical protein